MKRTQVATAMSAAALIALAGCGQSGPDAEKGDTVSLNALGKKVDTAMEEAGTGSITAKAGSEKVKSEFDLSGKGSATLEGETGGQKLDVRRIEDTFYLKAPSPQMTQPGKSWIKVDSGSKDPASQQMAASLEAMTELNDPIKALEGAGDLKAKVTKVEEDQVTYEIKASKEQMGKAAKKQAEEAGDKQAAAMAEQSAQATTVELVLDEQDRPVKSETSVGKQKLTINYGDWGGDVSIKAPSSDKVGTFEMPAQGGGAGGSGSAGGSSQGSSSSGS